MHYVVLAHFCNHCVLQNVISSNNMIVTFLTYKALHNFPKALMSLKLKIENLSSNPAQSKNFFLSTLTKRRQFLSGRFYLSKVCSRSARAGRGEKA